MKTKLVCVAVAACVVLALGVLATAEGPDATKPAFNRGTPIATEVLTPSSFSVQTSINYSRAMLRLSGPQGLQLTAEFGGDEQITVDLLKAKWLPTHGRRGEKAEAAAKTEGSNLLNGRYRYEVRFFKGDAKPQYFSGLFFVKNGAAVSRESVRSWQKQAREDLATPRRARGRRPGHADDTATKEYATDYYMYIYPQYPFPNTWFTMGSFDYYEQTLENFSLVNYQGDLRIGSGNYIYPSYDPYFMPQMTITRGYYYPGYAYPYVGIGTVNPGSALDVAGPYYPGVQISNTYFGQSFVLENWYGHLDVWDRNSNSYPFWIEPGTPNINPFFIQSTGNIGMGTYAPAATLHVHRDDGTAQVLVEETSTTETARTLFNLQNNGIGYIRLTDTSPDGSGWTFQAEGPSFRFNKAGTGGAEITVRSRNDASGQPTFTVTGSVAATNVSFVSSRKAKDIISEVDSLGVLERIVSLPISEWTFKDELNDRRHIGPMAEEFAESFGLGGDGKNISLIDASGVTLAAVQGLYEILQQKQASIESLEAENKELNRRLEQLEAAVGALTTAR